MKVISLVQLLSMFSVYKDIMGKYFVLLGRVLFFLFFWLNEGIYMGGKELYFGIFMPELEVLFPVSAIGILLVFFGVFIRQKQAYLSWQQYSFLLSILLLFIFQALTSFDSNMSVLFFPLFIVGILGTVLHDDVRVTAQKNTKLLLGGVLLGTVMYLFSELVITASLLSIGALLVWINIIRGNMFSRKKRFLFECALLGLFLLLNDFFAMTLYGVLLFVAPLWGPRLSKRDRSLQLGRSAFVIGVLLGGMLFQYWMNPWKMPVYTIGFFDRFILGTGLGQYLPYLQHQSSVFISPKDLQGPALGIVTWLTEWGIWGVLLSILVFIWNRKWGRMPFIYLFITLLFCASFSVFSIQENALLFWLLICLQRGPRLTD